MSDYDIRWDRNCWAVVVPAEQNRAICSCVNQQDAENIKAAMELMKGVVVIQLRIHCPECGALHVDEGEYATKPHHTHACQSCGNVWRPAIPNTLGVRFLPGFNKVEQ